MFNLESLAILAPGILIALTVHEFAHGWAAFKLGDPTAKNMGRLTLNPIAHLDPIGTIMLFVVHFGWAKPVPVDPRYFENPRKGMMLVALAGPASNVLLAAILGFVLQFLLSIGAIKFMTFGFSLMTFAIFINLMLAFFNMLPIPPLDGSKVVASYIPYRYLDIWMEFERYGFLVLIGIIFLGNFMGIPLFKWTILPISMAFFKLFTGGLTFF